MALGLLAIDLPMFLGLLVICLPMAFGLLVMDLPMSLWPIAILESCCESLRPSRGLPG